MTGLHSYEYMPQSRTDKSTVDPASQAAYGVDYKYGTATPTRHIESLGRGGLTDTPALAMRYCATIIPTNLRISWFALRTYVPSMW